MANNAGEETQADFDKNEASGSTNNAGQPTQSSAEEVGANAAEENGVQKDPQT